MIKNYKIVDTNIAHFLGITIPQDFEGYGVGDSFNLFGQDLQITQKGHSVVALANKTQVFVFQELVSND